MTEPATYKAFPRGHILVPVGSRASARAGVAMYTPGSRKGEMAQAAAWAAVSLGGARLLPGRAEQWRSAVSPAALEQMLSAVSDAVGSFDGHVVYERREGRPGLLLLIIRADEPVGFLKALRSQDGRIAAEVAALELLEAHRPRSFSVPELLVTGRAADEWSYLVTTPLPPRMHRMQRGAPDGAILDELAMALSPLARPPDTPAHWEPAHGDFTPWNLRRFGDGTQVLIDWEEAGWAPPGSDMVLYLASASALGRPVTGRHIEAGEARDYWLARIRGRVADHLAAGRGLSDLERGMLGALSGEKP